MSEYKDYCDFETCMSLKELGYNGSSDFTYCKHCRVSDEIAEKHPGLSDSGYMDLIDEYDGLQRRLSSHHRPSGTIHVHGRSRLPGIQGKRLRIPAQPDVAKRLLRPNTPSGQRSPLEERLVRLCRQ